jgi:hypothetical protein
MATPPLTFHKVLTMPASPVADGFYVVKQGARARIVVTGTDAVPLAAEPPVQMVFSSPGKPPADGEFGRYRVSDALVLEQSTSGAVAEAGATAAAVVRVTRGADLVARFSWAPGNSVPTVEVLVPTVAAGEVLIFHAPLVQDATLSGIAGTLVARHA